MELLGLPRYQYTVRELATGAQFLSYADSISATYAELTVTRLLTHLRELGIDLSEVDVQTDNGGEFGGSVRTEKDRGFVHTIEKILGATHTFIPPGCCNANADVESVHATIETDFFDVERCSSRGDFFAKITTYQLYYNLAHAITTRGDRSPFEILRNRDPTLDPHLFMLLPCDLDRTLRHMELGHDVPGLTGAGFRMYPLPRLRGGASPASVGGAGTAGGGTRSSGPGRPPSTSPPSRREWPRSEPPLPNREPGPQGPGSLRLVRVTGPTPIESSQNARSSA